MNYIVIFKVTDRWGKSSSTFNTTEVSYKAVLFKDFELNEIESLMERKEVLDTLSRETTLFSQTQCLDIHAIYDEAMFLKHFINTENRLNYEIGEKLAGKIVKSNLNKGYIFFLEKDIPVSDMGEYTLMEVFPTLKDQPQIDRGDIPHTVIELSNPGNYAGLLLYALDSSQDIGKMIECLPHNSILVVIHDLRISQIIYVVRKLYESRNTESRNHEFNFYLLAEDDRVFHVEVREDEISLKDPNLRLVKLE